MVRFFTLSIVFSMIGWCCFFVTVDTTLRGISIGVASCNITASSLSSVVCASPSVINVMDGALLYRAWIKSCIT